VDRELQYHARKVLQQKHPEAVKCMDGGKLAAWRRPEAQTGRSFWDVPVPRRCAVAGQR